MLVAGVVPAFLGESHFAFLGYAKNFRQTPIRRQLDYLRVLGGSKEAAKELKLFGLASFLTERFSRLSNQIYDEDVALARRRLAAGSFLSMIGTAGYYSAYVFVIWRTITGVLTIGELTFLAGAILQASLFWRLLHRRSSFILDRPDRFFRDAASHRIETQCPAGAATDHPRIRIPQRCFPLSRKHSPGS
jgi:ATP-binding cassette subfamily B protein